MVFKIIFEDATIGTIPEINIDSFVFLSSMFNTYNGAKLVLKNISREYFNKIKTGMKVSVVFYDTESNLEYTNDMGVLSFNKISGNLLIDIVEVSLISSLFFESEVVTSTHEGSVGTIIQNILQSKFPKYKSDITITDDNPRYRYQLEETYPQYFKRIMKYATVDNNTAYLYHDTTGTLCLKGISPLSKITPIYVASPNMTSFAGYKIVESESLIPLYAMDYKVYSSDSVYYSKVTSKFSPYTFSSDEDIPKELSIDTPVIQNPQIAKEFPNKTDFYNWDILPKDALASAYRKVFEEVNQTFKVSMSFNSIIVDELQIGSMLYVIFPYAPTEYSAGDSLVNSGEGKYMVTKVKYVYTNRVLSTEIEMIQIAY